MSAVAEHVGEVLCRACRKWIPAQSKHHACPGLIDSFTGKVDPGLEMDAALEEQIDEAYRRTVSLASDDPQSVEAFGEFHRLVLARSDHAQVKAEIDRRRR